MTPLPTSSNRIFQLLSLLLLLSRIHGTCGFSSVRRAHRVDRGAAAGAAARDGAPPPEARRAFLARVAAASLAAGALPPTGAARASFWAPERRQLELCLVAVLRTQYWAGNTARALRSQLLSPAARAEGKVAEASAGLEMSDNQRRLPYLEARLGAKALLTRKIGGGASSRVVQLGTFELKECLNDALYWCGELAKTNQLPSQQAGTKRADRLCSNDLTDTAGELLEALASLVEFDGLETTLDPSPRSSLMLGMYTPQKGAFVYRTLNERVIPSCERYLQVFGGERLRVVEEFVRSNHADEVPFEVLERFYEMS